MSTVPEILALDLAALRTLKLVYRHRSFAAAAAELGMNPSSISYTIERVRRAAADPLFVKQAGEIAPTAHCHDLMGSVERILNEAENIRDERDFDPASIKGEVAILASAYENEITMPPVIRLMRQQAPSVRLVLKFGFGPVREALLDGTADLYLGPQRLLESGFHAKEYLTRDYHLCMMDPAHPLARKASLSLADIAGADHLHYEPRPGWKQAHFRYAAAHGIAPNKVIVSTAASSFAEIIMGTDLLAALPSRVARRYEKDVALVPFDFETGMAEHMYWTAATDKSSLLQWVRALIVQEAAKFPPLP